MACRDCEHWSRKVGDLPWGTCHLLSSSEDDTEADSLITGMMCVSPDAKYLGGIVFTHALFSCVNEGEEVSKEARETHRLAYRKVMEMGDKAPKDLIASAKTFRYGRNG